MRGAIGCSTVLAMVAFCFWSGDLTVCSECDLNRTNDEEDSSDYSSNQAVCEPV